MRRIGHILDVLVAGAISFDGWLNLPRNPTSPQDQQDKARLANDWGWNDPAMEVHWQTYEADPSKHNLKNIGSEHARLDAQRAYKMYSYLISQAIIWSGCLFGVIGVGVGTIIGWLL